VGKRGGLNTGKLRNFFHSYACERELRTFTFSFPSSCTRPRWAAGQAMPMEPQQRRGRAAARQRRGSSARAAWWQALTESCSGKAYQTRVPGGK
jgi:hypothetical protein